LFVPLSYQWQFNGVNLPTNLMTAGVITTVAGKSSAITYFAVFSGH